MNGSRNRLDFVFTLWHGGGNVSPTLAVVRRLVERGHCVRVVSDACDREEVETTGADFSPWLRAPSRPDRSPASDILRDYEAPTPAEGFARVRDRISLGPAHAYAADLIEELERRPTDLVVSSEFLFGVMAGAESLGVPCALLTANLSLFLPIPGVPPFGPGLFPARTEAERREHAAIEAEGRAHFNQGLPALNAAREALGLPPLGDACEQLERAARILLGTSAAFDYPAETIPPLLRYVGPFLDDPTWTDAWNSPWPAGHPDPLVLVAFGTTPQRQEAALQRTIDALGELPVRGLVTLGPAIESDAFRVPSNVVLRTSAPHNVVLREAAAIVTHAGHGTVMRALAARVPLLCLPMGRDQDDNAARVVFHGAGLSLPPTAGSDEIRQSVGRLLTEPAFREAVTRLGDRVAADAAASPVVEELESLAAGNRSIPPACAA